MKNFLKIFCVVSIFITLFVFSSVFAVEADVQINGQIVDFTDSNGNKVNAQIINSRTMVPLRKIFEVLGCDIDWNNETRTVTANKLNKEIVLQINNKTAIIRENGVEEKISLDTAPVIVNNRTLVPLRFIAESLEKQVGWDSSTYTAIIIDYDYFSDLIKQKNPSLYNILTSTNSLTFSVTRDYIDTVNSANNDSATIKGDVIKNGDVSNVSISFTGNNDLINDIVSEGWNNFAYDAKYTEESIAVKTSNETLAKIINSNVNEYNNYSLKELNLKGSAQDNLSKLISSIFDVKDSKLYVSTFNNMKTDFNKFLDLIVLNGNRNITKANSQLNPFDYMDFDSFIYANEMSRTLSFINKKIFNYEINTEDLFYDWKKINYNMSCQNNTLVLKVTLENEYNEKVNYTILCEEK